MQTSILHVDKTTRGVTESVTNGLQLEEIHKYSQIKSITMQKKWLTLFISFPRE